MTEVEKKSIFDNCKDRKYADMEAMKHIRTHALEELRSPSVFTLNEWIH